MYNFLLNPRYLSLFLDLQPHPGEDQCSILLQTPVAEKTWAWSHRAWWWCHHQSPWSLPPPHHEDGVITSLLDHCHLPSMRMVSSPVSLIIATSSPMRARSVVTFVPTFTVVSSFLSEDDSKVDYTSLLGLDDKRKRFSEDVVDKNVKETIRLQKMYRELQRQVYCTDQKKESLYKDELCPLCGHLSRDPPISLNLFLQKNTSFAHHTHLFIYDLKFLKY